MTDEQELQRTAVLLNHVFEHAQPLTVESLRWYYDQNPAGVAAVGRVEEDGRRLGNYALVPNRYRSHTGEERVLGVGVDLAVDPEARGSGVFRRTVEDSYNRGATQGFDGILGVANANSAPRMVATLGWRSLSPFPVTMVSAVGRTRGFDSIDVSSTTLNVVDELGVDLFPRSSIRGFAPVWTSELLKWRLQRPNHSYSMHISDDVVVISTRTHVSRVPFGVILGVLLRRPSEPIPIGGVAAVVGRHHKAPFVIHWGRSPALRVRGIPLPQKLMPSPLSLVLHPFTPSFDAETFELGEFGFLDFDAY
jgi:GNAT superfamily N-acetyltransferase